MGTFVRQPNYDVGDSSLFNFKGIRLFFEFEDYDYESFRDLDYKFLVDHLSNYMLTRIELLLRRVYVPQSDVILLLHEDLVQVIVWQHDFQIDCFQLSPKGTRVEGQLSRNQFRDLEVACKDKHLIR